MKNWVKRWGIVFIFVVSISVDLHAVAQTQPVKPKPKPVQPVASNQTIIQTKSILDQAIDHAHKTLVEIKIEYPKFLALNTIEATEKLIILEIARKNAQWVIDHEYDLRQLYTAFEKGVSALPDQTKSKADFEKAKNEIELSPKNTCLPSEQGCFVTLRLGKVVAYFQELEATAKKYKGDPAYLENIISSPYATTHDLIPSQGEAALQMWNDFVLTDRTKNYPKLEWEHTHKRLIVNWLNQIDVLVMAENPIFKSNQAPSEDSKILVKAAFSLADFERLAPIRNQDQLIWAVINHTQVMMNQEWVMGLDRLKRQLRVKASTKKWICPDQVVEMGPYVHFNWNASVIISDVKACGSFSIDMKLQSVTRQILISQYNRFKQDPKETVVWYKVHDRNDCYMGVVWGEEPQITRVYFIYTSEAALYKNANTSDNTLLTNIKLLEGDAMSDQLRIQKGVDQYDLEFKSSITDAD